MSDLLPQSVPEAELRVSDGERRAADERLNRAVGDGELTLLEYEERTGAVWAARTRAELAAVTRDLYDPARTPATTPLVGNATPRRTSAVLSTEEVTGPFTQGQPVHAYSFLGTAKLDLRRDDLPREMHVRAVAVLGDVKVRVPDGATVHLSGGMALLGDRSVRVTPAQPGGPVIYLDATAVLGDVQVRSDGAPHPAVKALKDSHQRGSAAVRTGSDVQLARPGRRARRRIVGLALALGVGAVVVSQVDAPGTVAVMGSQTIRASAGENVRAGVLMGSVTVVVPDGVGAEMDGFVLMGSTECEDACATVGGNPVNVDVLGAMGSVNVVTASEYDAERAEEAREERLEDEREAREDRTDPD